MEPPPGMPPSYSGARERGVRTSSTGQVDTSALRGRASEERGERERTFATSTAVSPILRDSALRRMGERSVGATNRRRLGASSCFSVALQCYSRLLPVTPGFTFSGISLVVLELPGSTGMVGASAVHRRHDASRMPWFHHRRLAL